MPNYIVLSCALRIAKMIRTTKYSFSRQRIQRLRGEHFTWGCSGQGRATWPECSSSSYPSNAGHRGLCGAAGPLASPPCSTILLVVSGSWTVVSCLLVRRSEVRKTYVTILVTLLPFSQQHVPQLISFLSLKCYLHWHLRCHTPNHSYL